MTDLPGHRDATGRDAAHRDASDSGDFTLANLPFGVGEASRWDGPRVLVAIGDHAVDCRAALAAGWFDGLDHDDAEFAAPSLNRLIARGRPALELLRRRIADHLGDERTDLQSVLVSRSGLRMRCPIEVADYVDFYSSEHHARNLGRILRPGEEPLSPNWRHIPVGYHGRAGSVVVSGSEVRRPSGVIGLDEAGTPRVGPTRMLDIELEVAAVVGPPTSGAPLPVECAEEHVVGLLLMNDWSARDIQAFEYRPLGPNLGKSFATTVSPWLVTIDALAPFRVDGPDQSPPPPAHLAATPRRNVDLRLQVGIRTAAMRAADCPPVVIAGSEFATMYWGIAQQVAHLTSNGGALRTGDLLGSGTVSGPGPTDCGSLIELTERGAHPLRLPNGEERGFLEDGDEITLRGWAGDGATRVGFGSAIGIVATGIGPVVGGD